MLSELRDNYRKGSLDKKEVPADPFHLFQTWLDEALVNEPSDPTAMVLSTVDSKQHPQARVVLLKIFDSNGFVFFTNYKSNKAKEMENNPNVSLLFHWKSVERQVRICGTVSKVNEQISVDYFNSRPFESQIGAWASPQSSIIESRAVIEDNYQRFHDQFTAETIQKPEHWGGFCVKPVSFEFWQGRENRLHDRILYNYDENLWNVNRLAP